MKVLAIDIGNTSARMGLVDTDTLACLARGQVATAALKERFAELHGSFTASLGPGAEVPAAASCVVPAVREWLEAALSGHGSQLRWLQYTPRLPLTVAYADPGAFGADRLANAVYCVKAFPAQTVVVVDAGTAVKVDLVESGRHVAGGTIFPGIAAQLRSLSTATAALPLLETALADSMFPGRSTVECMQAGVLYGLAGGIGRIVRELINIGGAGTQVVATGGAWRILDPLIDFPHRYLADMTLIGIALFRTMVDG